MAISQREARRLKKRVEELEELESNRRNRWASVWPGGVHIGSVVFDHDANLVAKLGTARALKHAIVAIPCDNRRKINFYAVPLVRQVNP